MCSCCAAFFSPIFAKHDHKSFFSVLYLVVMLCKFFTHGAPLRLGGKNKYKKLQLCTFSPIYVELFADQRTETSNDLIIIIIMLTGRVINTISVHLVKQILSLVTAE